MTAFDGLVSTKNIRIEKGVDSLEKKSYFMKEPRHAKKAAFCTTFPLVFLQLCKENTCILLQKASVIRSISTSNEQFERATCTKLLGSFKKCVQLRGSKGKV